MNKKLKFVSYDGKYPSLCSGTLIMELDEKNIIFPDYCLSSGGSACVTEELEKMVEIGEWTINDFPENFPEELKEYANLLVNENIEYGCCGGCLY